MQDKELYYQLLGLSDPWKVTEVATDIQNLKIDVYIEWPAERLAACPECGKLYGDL